MDPRLKLKALRQQYDLNQKEMAEILDMPLGTYRKKEQGATEFKESEINKIISCFDIKYEDIFFTS